MKSKNLSRTGCIVSIVFFCLIFTAACSNNDPEESAPEVEETDTTTISLDNESIELTTDELENYQLVTATTSVVATSDSVEVEKEERDIIGLFNAGGKPLLFGVKHAGDDSADVSISSTSVMMVLLTTKFKGKTSTDSKELERRIRAHSSFEELGASISRAIEYDNPCPLDPDCNFRMAQLALTISNEIEVADLYEESN